MNSAGVADLVTHSETLPKTQVAFGALSLLMLARETIAP